jgi:hypothetical protein
VEGKRPARNWFVSFHGRTSKRPIVSKKLPVHRPYRDEVIKRFSLRRLRINFGPLDSLLKIDVQSFGLTGRTAL